VYDWAGRLRSVRISKGANAFCFPEHIDAQMKKLFGALADKKHLSELTKDQFAKEAAHFLAEINAIHPFREGNGRVQLSFLTLLAEHAGHPLDFEKLDPQAILDATIASFGGSEAPLSKLIGDLAQ
jgi:cell filamentation protein